MSDLRQFSKVFIADFIKLYKRYPCLWKTKCSDYNDRHQKEMAYSVLLKKLQEMEPNATKKTVTTKINSIRGSFRREMKKIKDSKRSGAQADEIYVTRLWYYDLLLFLKDQEKPGESVSNLVENREDESGSDKETDKTQNMEHVDYEVESLMSLPTKYMSRSSEHSDRKLHRSTPSSTPSTTSKGSKRKWKINADKQANEVLTMMDERLRNNNDDAFNIFGKYVAVKLRTLPKDIKLYTEKLINDLLFEAEMGNIDKNTKIVTLANKPTNVIDSN